MPYIKKKKQCLTWMPFGRNYGQGCDPLCHQSLEYARKGLPMICTRGSSKQSWTLAYYLRESMLCFKATVGLKVNENKIRILNV
jgi:hypothetical protein